MRSPIKVMVQEPQFLPYPGFWHRVAHADVCVVYAGVKFDKYDHQHRVTLGGGWLTLPVAAGQRNAMVCDVRLAEGHRAELLRVSAGLRQRCMSRANKHRDRLGIVVELLETHRPGTVWLADLTYVLNTSIARLLGLTARWSMDVTPRSGMGPHEKLDDIISGSTRLPAVYLSGPGGRSYMDFQSLKRPIETRFQVLRDGFVRDSVVQLIANEDDPLATIMTEATWVGPNGAVHEDPARLRRHRDQSVAVLDEHPVPDLRRADTGGQE